MGLRVGALQYGVLRGGAHDGDGATVGAARLAQDELSLLRLRTHSQCPFYTSHTHAHTKHSGHLRACMRTNGECIAPDVVQRDRDSLS